MACPPTLAALLLQVDVLQKLFLSATKCPGDDLTLQNWTFHLRCSHFCFVSWTCEEILELSQNLALWPWPAIQGTAWELLQRSLRLKVEQWKPGGVWLPH